MPNSPRAPRFLAVTLTALALSACGASTYTGPIEVTRFVADRPAQLGQGEIMLTFPDEIENQRVREAFAVAVAAELGRLGYILVAGSDGSSQTAAVRTSRNGIDSTDRRNPVTVGGSAGGGTFGGGVGLGVGINLGGGRSGPNIVTELSVRISDPAGEALWEGRAQLPTSVKSPYSEVETSARTLAAALFKDFPGGNGETVTIEVDDL